MLAPTPMLAPALRFPEFPSMRAGSAGSMPFERLRSPVHLTESCITPPPLICTPIASRTRSKAAQSLRRPRLAPRTNCQTAHAFDELPWISTLEADQEPVNLWDIADLSLISDSFADPLYSSGPGPVRRRKTSLRSTPIKSAKNHSPGSLPAREIFIPPSNSVSTPRSRFNPSRVLFHNLMPVSCDYRAEQPQPCITRSRINF